jgi:hypothetical protein
MINVEASGSLEVDDNGRHNIVWIAGNDVGTLHISGSAVGRQDLVKIVLPHDATKVHLFPSSSAGVRMEVCADCSRTILA